MASSLTVLLAVYKEDKPQYFSRALESIWDDQILKPFEIVLVEDGPLTPELYRIISVFRTRVGKALKIIKNPTNLGLTKSLNRGIEAATGDYIARMDSDDIALPNRFKVQLEYLDSHPEVMVLGGGMQEIDENNRPTHIRIYPSSSDQIRQYISKANPIPHPTVVFNAKLFKRGVRYDEQYRKNQDLKLWFDLLNQGIILENLPDVVLKFRRTGDTYQKRASKISILSEYQIYDNGIKRLHGKWTLKRMYPIMRYAVKSMPPWVAKSTYKFLFKKK